MGHSRQPLVGQTRRICTARLDRGSTYLQEQPFQVSLLQVNHNGYTVVSVMHRLSRSTSCGVSRGNRRNCWKTRSFTFMVSVGVVSLLSRDVRGIYYPVPLLLSLGLLGLSYPRVAMVSCVVLVYSFSPGVVSHSLSSLWGRCCVLVIPGGGLYCSYGRSVLPPPPLDHGLPELVHVGSYLLGIRRMPLSIYN